MFGWWTDAAVVAARRNFSTTAGSRARSGPRILIATGRPSSRSCARYTRAAGVVASCRRSSYRPARCGWGVCDMASTVLWPGPAGADAAPVRRGPVTLRARAPGRDRVERGEVVRGRLPLAGGRVRGDLLGLRRAGDHRSDRGLRGEAADRDV